MSTLAELKNYLLYMRELGIEALALEHNPFLPARPVPVATVTARGPAPSSSSPAKPAKPPRKEKTGIPNLATIMDSVEALAGGVDNRAIAAGIAAPDAVGLLRNLFQTFKDCQACSLCTTRGQFVFGEGPPRADLVVVGDGPDKESNLSGRPFVGPAGDLLTKIIEAMNLQRKDVFITNVVKCMPPDRSPLPDEMMACAPILERQIEAVNPKVIVAMGPVAYRFFYGSDSSLVRGRGRFFDWKTYPVMPTYHPAYILRNPRSKRDVWKDLQQVMNRLAG